MLEMNIGRALKNITPNIPNLFAQPAQITLDTTYGYRCNSSYQDTIYEGGYVKTEPIPANVLIQVPGIVPKRIRGVDATFRMGDSGELGDCYLRITYTDILTGLSGSVVIGCKDSFSSSSRPRIIYNGYNPATETLSAILTQPRLRLKNNHVCTKLELYLGKTPQYPTVPRGVNGLKFYYY